MLRNVLVGIEKGERNFSAYAPEYDGCVATGKTLEEVRRNMARALEAHLNAIVEDGGDLVDDDTLFCLMAVPVHADRQNATGESLRQYRKRQGMTQAELAQKWDVAPESISLWERGARPLPGTVKALLEVAG
jgi:predicted RNase H-like HicB family nuclease/DNA-binding XRE family transcriptional regulator